ncbi:N-acetylmuramoyl-L-alanine amidase [Alkaliphilus transvaalensis]|jgi:hypothetical protein|nr:N-acetylmuramoyl-L-alanine amidase [Alkaliphilus transvaalensis]
MAKMHQPKPSIVSRNTWGSRRDTRVGINRQGKEHIIIHHCASNNSTVDSRTEYEHMREIQGYHMDANNWTDIAYHFGIGKNGTIMDGRLLKYASYASNKRETTVDENGIQVFMHGHFHVGDHVMSASQRSSTEE